MPDSLPDRCPECKGTKDKPQMMSSDNPPLPGRLYPPCDHPFHSGETAECETCDETNPGWLSPPYDDMPCPDCSPAPEPRSWTMVGKSLKGYAGLHNQVVFGPNLSPGQRVEVVEKAELDRVREELGRLRSRVERCGMHATASIEAFQDGMEMAGRAITPDAFLDEIEIVVRERDEARAELEGKVSLDEVLAALRDEGKRRRQNPIPPGHMDRNASLANEWHDAAGLLERRFGRGS